MKSEREAAAETFIDQGYNCAQSVLASFPDETGMDRDTLLRLTCTFGGGLSGLHEACGALTGAFMVMGLCRGYSDTPNEPKARREALRDRMQAFAGAFSEMSGALRCEEILAAKGDEELRVYCGRIVKNTVGLLEKELEKD